MASKQDDSWFWGTVFCESNEHDDWQWMKWRPEMIIIFLLVNDFLTHQSLYLRENADLLTFGPWFSSTYCHIRWKFYHVTGLQGRLVTFHSLIIYHNCTSPHCCCFNLSVINLGQKGCLTHLSHSSINLSIKMVVYHSGYQFLLVFQMFSVKICNFRFASKFQWKFWLFFPFCYHWK